MYPDTSHRGYLEEPPPLTFEVSETSVSYAREFPASPLAAWRSAATGLPSDTTCVQRESGVFVSPALHLDQVMTVSSPPATWRASREPHGGASGEAVRRTVFVRAVTPVDARTTQVLWRVAGDFGQGDVLVNEVLRRVHERTMAEDEPLLGAIQGTTDRGGQRRAVNAEVDAGRRESPPDHPQAAGGRSPTASYLTLSSL